MSLNDSIALIEDLYRYNEWANARVFEMCLELTNAQLDEEREIGFGSLRNTLFHILTAEQIWLERWQVAPWRPFPSDSQGMSLSEIEAQLKQISQARQQLISSERAEKWKRVVNYKDSRGTEFSEPLDVLLLHVANHGVYHRAQALHYLKGLGRTVPVGIDYALYKLARPSLKQSPESLEAFKKLGLEVATAPGWKPRWDRELVERYTTYDLWANEQIFATLEGADDATLDRDFGMGFGSIRKTLTHLLQAETRCHSLWNDNNPNTQLSEALTLEQLCELAGELGKARAAFVVGLDDAGADRVVTVRPGSIPFDIRVGESLLHLCCHGTHHRAQLVNMLRHSSRTVPGNDVTVWWRSRA
jgi:uncharacterized damage-inducible protein DinB